MTIKRIRSRHSKGPRKDAVAAASSDFNNFTDCVVPSSISSVLAYGQKFVVQPRMNPLQARQKWDKCLSNFRNRLCTTANIYDRPVIYSLFKTASEIATTSFCTDLVALSENHPKERPVCSLESLRKVKDFLIANDLIIHLLIKISD